MIRIVALTLIASFVLIDEAPCQSQSNGRRARIFRKLREDLFGSKKEVPESTDSKTQKPNSVAATRIPTPVGPSAGSTRNSVLSQANRRTEIPYAKKPLTYNFSSESRSRTSEIKPPKSKSTSTKSGFGFIVAVNSKDQIIATKVDPNGNAAESGLRRGDRILEIGGIEATSIEEFDEIAKIMSDGDQMEFLVKRNGSEKKIDIQFGEIEDIDEPNMPQNDSRSILSERTVKRYDFAPPSRNTPTPRSVNAGNSYGQNRIPNNAVVPAGTNRQIQLLNQTIVNQNRQIQQLQQELARIRRYVRSR